MRELDPGHLYELQLLDGAPGDEPPGLRFVKREGDKFPFNEGHYAGTNLQEVLRACARRVLYLKRQGDWLQRERGDATASENDDSVWFHLSEAIYLLEMRAAHRHGRATPSRTDAVYGPTCVKCGHVECGGECHSSDML